jgi:hypothetical protein
MPRRTNHPKRGRSRSKGSTSQAITREEGLIGGRSVEDRGFETVEVSVAAATGIGVGTVLGGPVGAAADTTDTTDTGGAAEPGSSKAPPTG